MAKTVPLDAIWHIKCISCIYTYLDRSSAVRDSAIRGAILEMQLAQQSGRQSCGLPCPAAHRPSLAPQRKSAIASAQKNNQTAQQKVHTGIKHPFTSVVLQHRRRSLTLTLTLSHSPLSPGCRLA